MFSFKGVYSRSQWLGANMMIIMSQYIMIFLLATVLNHSEGFWGNFNFKAILYNFEYLLKRDEMLMYFTGLFLLLGLFTLGYLSIVTSVKRLHDISRSGKWWWIQLVPFIGGLILISMNAFYKSVKKNNIYIQDKALIVDLPIIRIIAICFLFIGSLSLIFEFIIHGIFIEGMVGLSKYMYFIIIAMPIILIFFGFEYDKYLSMEISKKNRFIMLLIISLFYLFYTGYDLISLSQYIKETQVVALTEKYIEVPLYSDYYQTYFEYFFFVIGALLLMFSLRKMGTNLN